jgi:hypothetical protein
MWNLNRILVFHHPILYAEIHHHGRNMLRIACNLSFGQRHEQRLGLRVPCHPSLSME